MTTGSGAAARLKKVSINGGPRGAAGSQRGFTLIELLVVIAIVGILAALLFPVLVQAKNAAKTTTELSEIRQLAAANIMYANDFDDAYSFAMDLPGKTPGRRMSCPTRAPLAFTRAR